MSLFDIARNSEEKSFGNFYRSQKPDSVKTESVVKPEIIAARAAELKKHDNARAICNETHKTTIEGAVLPGMKKAGVKPRMEEQKFATSEEISAYTLESKSVFTDALTDKLFVDKLNVVILEACPIDSGIKGREDIQNYVFEMAHSMFKDIKKGKDFSKVVSENKLPSFVCELYTLAYECAVSEAEGRFHQKKVFENCGLSVESVSAYIGAELENISIVEECTFDYFNDMADVILYENEDVMSSIKSKVTAEIENYKAAAKKVDDIKKAVSTAQAGTDTAAAPETAPAEGETPPAAQAPAAAPETPPADGAAAPAEGETPPAEPNTEPTNDETPASAVSETVAAEIDDAASFAESNSHTFNTGDEKFDALRAKYAAEMVDAANRNDLTKLNELKANIAATTSRLQSISDGSNGKYAALAKKFTDLSSNVQFELNKKIESTTKTARENRSIFENFVLSIGTRYLNQIAVEGKGIADIPADKVIDEAVIYYTALEAFNTLKIMDLRNKVEFEAFSGFLGSFTK